MPAARCPGHTRHAQRSLLTSRALLLCAVYHRAFVLPAAFVREGRGWRTTSPAAGPSPGSSSSARSKSWCVPVLLLEYPFTYLLLWKHFIGAFKSWYGGTVVRWYAVYSSSGGSVQQQRWQCTAAAVAVYSSSGGSVQQQFSEPSPMHAACPLVPCSGAAPPKRMCVGLVWSGCCGAGRLWWR
jgi:hypothetical protein